MEPQKFEKDNSKAMDYIRSLRDPVKKRFGTNYLNWIRAGRNGAPPNRGNLSPTFSKTIIVNLDSLA